MSKTFSACQTFGLTNLENLPDRMKTCQTEYKFYIVAKHHEMPGLMLINIMHDS